MGTLTGSLSTLSRRRSHFLGQRLSVGQYNRTIFTITKEERLGSKSIQDICLTVLSIPNDESNQSLANGMWKTIAAIATGGEVKRVWQTLGEDRMLREIRSGVNSSACKVALGIPWRFNLSVSVFVLDLPPFLSVNASADDYMD